MLTLQKVGELVRDRLAEISEEFWAEKNIRYYINSAQTFIATLTRGVRKEVTGTASRNDGTLPLPAKVLNAHADGGFVHGGEALRSIAVNDANLINPSWRTWKDRSPRWVVLDFPRQTAHLVPIPTRDVDVSLFVSVLPDDVAAGSDKLFNGVGEMDKYLEPLVNIATCVGLLKERYDNDAERFYQMGMSQLRDMGIAPTLIPSFQQMVEQHE